MFFWEFCIYTSKYSNRTKNEQDILNLLLGELEFVSNLGISSLGFIQCRYTFRHLTLKKERPKTPLPAFRPENIY